MSDRAELLVTFCLTTLAVFVGLTWYSRRQVAIVLNGAVRKARVRV